MHDMENSEHQDLAHKVSDLQLNVFFGPEIWPLQNQGGISRYYGELIKGMSALNRNTYVFIPENRNQFVNMFPDRCKILNDRTKSSELIQVASRIINKEKNSIYHATYFGDSNLLSWKNAGFKTFVTVYDLISEKFPERKSKLKFRTDLKKKAIKNADHLICISHTTKRDLIDYYKVPESKISVVYLGSTLGLLHQTVSNPFRDIPYLLFVGKRNSYKNFIKLVNIFASSKLLKSNFVLIAFGGGEFSRSEKELISSLDLENRIIQISGDDSMLSQLYLEAKALIYPSLYEGFGLPPLEAMAHGCPVFASSAGSIPEICQNAAIYFDPKNQEQMTNIIEEAIFDTRLLTEKVLIGSVVSKSFTWEKTVDETMKAYGEIQ